MGARIERLRHSSFRITAEAGTVYIDPWQLSGENPPADLIIVTHDHSDHHSPEDIEKLRRPGTRIVGAPLVAEKTAGCQPLAAGESMEVGPFSLRAVPAHNLDKFREPGVLYHPPGFGIGVLLTIAGETILHAGDTDNIPELAGLAPDVALLPVSGTFVMTAGEAAEAVKAIRPVRAIPMHYGVIIGSEEDAIQFAELAGSHTRVDILQPLS